MSPSLTAEEKNTKMSAERAFLTKLLEAALTGKGDTVASCVTQYSHDHGIAPLEVLTQFRDGQKRTALHFACQSHDDEIVEQILRPDWFPTAAAYQTILKQKDREGLTPLMFAARHADAALAERRVLFLLGIGKDMKLGLARSQAGATALHYAAGAGATAATIRALYEAGHVAIHTFSQQGGTPLHWAVGGQKDCSATIEALLDCGAKVEAQPSSNIPSPLVLAVAASNDKHAKLILAKTDVDIDTTLPGGLTLFHMAADLNLVGTLAALLDKLEDDKRGVLLQKNHSGLTPLDLAAQESHVGCVLLLLPAKEDGTQLTEADARAYIEEHKKNNEHVPTTAPPRSQDDDAQAQTADDKGKSKCVNNKEENEAQAQAAEIASSDDVSEELQKKALDIKAEGNKHFAKKEWTQAESIYSDAIGANPKDATFYSNRSACYMMMKRPDDALRDAVIARTLRPTWSKACYRMAVARLELERYEDAALAAWEGLQLDQNNDELKSLLQKCVKRGRKDFLQAKDACTCCSG